MRSMIQLNSHPVPLYVGIDELVVFMILKVHLREHYLSMTGVFIGVITTELFTLDTEQLIGSLIFGGWTFSIVTYFCCQQTV